MREKLRADEPPKPDLDAKRTVVVLSGKGGVGKSTVASQLSFSLARRGLRVGLLDLDICGPSIPHMLGCRGHRVGQIDGRMAPVTVEVGGAGGSSATNISVMSIGFLLSSESDAVTLRGPRKDAVVRQFLSGVGWGSLDYLIIDTPPGTSDEHLSLVSALSKTLDARTDGALVVSTPQAVSLVDVRKELSFCRANELPVLGLVENMAAGVAPLAQLTFLSASGEDVSEATLATLAERCPELLNTRVGLELFPPAEGGVRAVAAEFDVRLLGSLPLDLSLAAASDSGETRGTPAFEAMVDRLLASEERA